MTQTEMIMSIVSVLACLLLVTRGGILGRLGIKGVVRYGLIWGVIIAGLMLIMTLLAGGA